MTLAAGVGRSLESGIVELGLSIPGDRVDGLLQYLELLDRWNRAYNLTAVRDPLEMVTRHLLDCLSILPFLPTGAGRWIDVGTGAGLPGVVLAIVYPQRTLHLLDSNGKKTRFLFQVKTALGLDNMAVHHARVEGFEPEYPYEVVLSRAFASLSDMVAYCRHLCAPGGRLLAMKGAYPTAEVAALPPDVSVVAAHRVVVPGLVAERHLLELELAGSGNLGERA